MTNLESAQKKYDQAARELARAQADTAARQNELAQARSDLEEAKRKVAEQIPVDRSARELSGNS